MKIREPVNGASHLIGLLLAGAGTILLLRMARGPEQLAAALRRVQRELLEIEWP